MKSEFKVKKISGSIRIKDGLELHTTAYFDKKIKKRQIKINDIKETYINFDSKYPSKNKSNVTIYQKLIGNNLYKIVVKDDKAPYILITAYITPLN